MDIDFKTRGGRTLPVRLFHKVAFGADGAPGASRTLVLNRARGEATDPQRAAEVRFMRFFQSTPMAIATVDKAGRISRTNTLFARLFQGTLKDGGDGKGEARSILSVVAERDREALESAVRRAAEGQSDVDPVDAALVGGEERWGRFYLSPVEEDERDAEAAIVYVLETTGQRTLENQVNQRRSMESVGQLAGGIAHDFNNVLSAIMMATDFLLNAHKPTDPSFQDIMQIKQNANRAASLVRQLLAFSRRQTLRPQVLDLGERLERSAHHAEPADRREGHARGQARPRPLAGEGRHLPVRAGDRQSRGQRARRHAGRRQAHGAHRQRHRGGGRALRYKGMPAADYVLVEVADTGTGIPPEIIDKIFEPFFSTKEVGKGTGPRPLDRLRHRQADRRLRLSGLGAGKGTTFRIFLPRHVPGTDDAALPEAEAPGIATTDAEPAAADLTGHGTILLVEDEEGLRALNARGLTSRGYTVLEAGNGVEAIEVLGKHGGKVDLVVSDVVMPEMDGPTMAKELRKTNPQLKIIFVSGYAEEAFEKNLPPDAQFAFLAKPFTLKQLIGVVKETMKG